MKLAKSLFLGSVAGLAAIAGAQAADLPVAKAAPVEYVRVCSTYGAAFFYIPGTETCLRVGGRVRGEFMYLEPNSREDDSIGFRARGRIQLDARTATAYGLLRTFVRFEMTRNTGSYGFNATSPDVAQAFIQFGGLTAGRVTSFFSNSDLPNENWGTLRFFDAPDVNLFAYTFSFGNGFSATLSAEEGYFAGAFDGPASFVYAGQTMPDLVGNLKYAGTWGSAQLSGALHQLRSNNLVAVAPGIVDYPDTKLGWAISATGNVNLPMLGEGDAAWINAAYADGALSYITGGSTDSLSAGVLAGILVDGWINPATGNISSGRGWSVAGGLRHYWTPTVRQSVFGSYARFDYSAAASQFGIVDFNEARVGTNVIWSPVSGLDIGAEVMYARVDPRGRFTFANGQSFGSDSAWEGRLRVQRDF